MSASMYVMRISREIFSAVLAHARATPDRETCGLLAGRDSTITQFFPAENASPTPRISYEIAPRELFHIMRELRAANLELLGIYHSHPASDNSPSPTDIASAYYPETVYVIVSPRAGAANPVRAFYIQPGNVTEVRIEAVEP